MRSRVITKKRSHNKFLVECTYIYMNDCWFSIYMYMYIHVHVLYSLALWASRSEPSKGLCITTGWLYVHVLMKTYGIVGQTWASCIRARFFKGWGKGGNSPPLPRNWLCPRYLDMSGFDLTVFPVLSHFQASQPGSQQAQQMIYVTHTCIHNRTNMNRRIYDGR